MVVAVETVPVVVVVVVMKTDERVVPREEELQREVLEVTSLEHVV